MVEVVDYRMHRVQFEDVDGRMQKLLIPVRQVKVWLKDHSDYEFVARQLHALGAHDFGISYSPQPHVRCALTENEVNTVVGWEAVGGLTSAWDGYEDGLMGLNILACRSRLKSEHPKIKDKKDRLDFQALLERMAELDGLLSSIEQPQLSWLSTTAVYDAQHRMINEYDRLVG